MTKDQVQAMTREELLAYVEKLRALCGRAVEAVDSITWQWEGEPLTYPERKAKTLLNDLIDESDEPISFHR